MLGVVGGILIYLSVVWPQLGRAFENCTQDSLDKLLINAVLSLACASIGCGMLLRKQPSRLLLGLLAPAVLLQLLELRRAVQTTYGMVGGGRSICQQLFDLPYGMNGQEPLLLGLWFATSAIVGVSAVIVGARAVDRGSPTPK